MAGATIDPFVEAPVDRANVSSSAGIDTSAIDHLRQGTSIRVNRHRYAGTQPKIWSGELDHQAPVVTFGIPSLFSDNLPFDDLTFDFDINRAIAHFYSGTVSITEAFGTAGDDDGEIESFDGAIEPLEIRTTILPYVSGTVPTRVVAGSFAEGNRGEPILQEVRLDEPYIASPFIESGSYRLLPGSTYTAESGQASGSVVSRAEILKVQQQTIRTLTPFDDTEALTSRLPASYVTTAREQFRDVMQQLSSSTDVEKFRQRRSAGAGSTYHNTPFGTDSIAFGGLERYKVPT